MKPTIGRSVHFVERGRHFAATVTAVHSATCVNLTVFGYTPYLDTEGGETLLEARPAVHVTSIVEDAKGKNDRSWHWPEREEDATDEKPAKRSRGKATEAPAAAAAESGSHEDAATDAAPATDAGE